MFFLSNFGVFFCCHYWTLSQIHVWKLLKLQKDGKGYLELSFCLVFGGTYIQDNKYHPSKVLPFCSQPPKFFGLSTGTLV